MPVSRETHNDMRCLRGSKKELQKPPKPDNASRKIVLIKGRFRHPHRLTHQDFWDIICLCGGRWIRDGCPTHAVVDFKWAKSGDPRLKNVPKLMKPDWLIASKNGTFANSVEYQWTPQINEKATSKSHVRDHGLLTPPDSPHHSPTTKRELEPPVNHFKNYANIPIRVEQDRQETTGQVNDKNGHYIVVPRAKFTDHWKLDVPYAPSTLLIQAADRIIRLLGQGSFGRVIKAREKETRREVAIKITRDREAAKIEIRVLATLQAGDRKNSHQCLHMMDCFDYKGHICIVTDLLRQSLHSFLKKNNRVPFPDTHVQTFARQLFKSVAYLHRQQIIHTDIKPDNILLYDDSCQLRSYNQIISSHSKNVKTRAYRWELLHPKICLIDFGSATFQNENHEELVTTRYYRAPEVILKLGWSFPCDIWSIGCVLVELLTGTYLFYTNDDMEHLAMMEKGLGQTLHELLAQLAPEPCKAVYLNYPSKHTTHKSKKRVKNMKSLSDIMPSETPFFQEFLDLLQKIFVYDPSKRITAEQALNHPWLKENWSEATAKTRRK